MATSALHLLPILVAAILMSPHRLPTTAAAAAADDNRTRGGFGGFSLRLEASGSHDHDATDGLGLHGNLRPVVLPVKRLAYSVVVRFGTGPQGRDYKLGLGMGALTWIRCKPCQPELPQDGPPFDPALSRSYQPVAGNDRLCSPAVPGAHPTSDGKCGFKLAAAQGILARETMTLGAAAGSSAGSAVRDFAFGCAAATTSAFDNYGALAGAVGLGRPVAGSLSLLAQLAADRAADTSRFSYCLFAPDQAGAHGFLRFGGDVPAPADARRQSYARTPILPPRDAAAGGESAYHVRLVGVSVNGARVAAVTAAMFARRGDGSGGCVVDAGSRLTRVPRPALVHVQAAVLQHLQHWGAERVRRNGSSLSLCVRRTAKVAAHVPTMTLHLDGGADLHLQGKEVLMNVRDPATSRDDLCLVMEPAMDDGGPATIGALQQVDTRFVFDVRGGTLSFWPEKCHLDRSTVPASQLNGT